MRQIQSNIDQYIHTGENVEGEVEEGKLYKSDLINIVINDLNIQRKEF